MLYITKLKTVHFPVNVTTNELLGFSLTLTTNFNRKFVENVFFLLLLQQFFQNASFSKLSSIVSIIFKKLFN